MSPPPLPPPPPQEQTKCLMRPSCNCSWLEKRASFFNNAMIAMRDSKGELGSVFDWVDIRTDTLSSNKVVKKNVKELQGSLYTPTCQSGTEGNPPAQVCNGSKSQGSG
ncbi:hypothetical protein PAMP_007569 [Pampus punctatissimus]